MLFLLEQKMPKMTLYSPIYSTPKIPSDRNARARNITKVLK